jgi:hypothetical protein
MNPISYSSQAKTVKEEGGRWKGEGERGKGKEDGRRGKGEGGGRREK